jgi:hypothetical protein
MHGQAFTAFEFGRNPVKKSCKVAKTKKKCLQGKFLLPRMLVRSKKNPRLPEIGKFILARSRAFLCGSVGAVAPSRFFGSNFEQI